MNAKAYREQRDEARRELIQAKVQSEGLRDLIYEFAKPDSSLSFKAFRERAQRLMD